MKNRKLNRLKDYDYSKNNLYFVTSCAKNMDCCFGVVGTGRDLSVHNPDKNNPDKNNPDKNNPDKNNPDKYNPDKNNPDKNNPDKYNPDTNNPDKNNPDKYNPDKNNPNESEAIVAQMILNKFGIIAQNQLEWLENQFPYIILHAHIVMPNHIHAIIEIDSNRVNHNKSATETSEIVKIKPLSQIMGAYKTTTSKKIHLAGYQDFAWHRSFHDHIIKDQKSYANITNYIESNPKSWFKDKFFN